MDLISQKYIIISRLTTKKNGNTDREGKTENFQIFEKYKINQDKRRNKEPVRKKQKQWKCRFNPIILVVLST